MLGLGLALVLTLRVRNSIRITQSCYGFHDY